MSDAGRFSAEQRRIAGLEIDLARERARVEVIEKDRDDHRDLLSAAIARADKAEARVQGLLALENEVRERDEALSALTAERQKSARLQEALKAMVSPWKSAEQRNQAFDAARAALANPAPEGVKE